MGRSSPSPIATSLPSESTVNIIDFGLAKKYRDPVTGEHIPYWQNEDGLHGVGTSLFASLNTHLGIGLYLSHYRCLVDRLTYYTQNRLVAMIWKA